jgi:hypothetical protein
MEPKMFEAQSFIDFAIALFKCSRRHDRASHNKDRVDVVLPSDLTAR